MGRQPSTNKNLPIRMRRRVQRSGIAYYYYDAGGSPRVEIPLGSDYVAAVMKWAELEQDKTTRIAGLITFRYAATRYIKEVLPGKSARSQKDNLTEFEFLLEFFGDAPLDEIDPQHIRQYMEWRVRKSREMAAEKNRQRMLRGLAPLKIPDGLVRANREKALFSHVFNMARNWGLTKAQNPCAGIKGNTETGRDVYVEDETYNVVYNAADQPTKDAMDLAYLTGQRPADTVKYRETDMKDGYLELAQNKTTKKLRIQIIGELEAVLARIIARKRFAENFYGASCLELIVNEKGRRLTQEALRQRFYDVRQKTGVKSTQFQFRDLRAKAGTDKADEAGDMRAAQRQLGHKSLAMTETYVRERKGDKVTPTR
ncbi:tyrosine-type recombinase/integrase [Herbaspirillum sp. NPDC101397]|uniref:tyrosine-type recombinase/integrase n=1 Tax=Herbaspirillum sp. NPDC101397 TaxID=3364006 RepID=UPI00383BBE0F